MTAPGFERVRAMFLAARDLTEGGRASLLQRECGADRALQAEVESLLAHHDRKSAHQTTPVLGLNLGAILNAHESPDEPLPRSFGRFELLEVLGRGGMGAVYRARQRVPDRIVALKVIRPGMMTPTMLSRFRHEAELLGRLQHPGIAQIFEAGTERIDGVEQPYFAMEFVSGRPIDQYVAEKRFSINARIELLVRVCDAVHHAHQKGVIHRDLKPANILVDATGQPRVLDFGVARATDADLRATMMRTEIGQLIGTLPYMSPEQISGDPDRFDVRSDVYALGVLAFELLTGRLPHDLGRKTIADAALMIRDSEPARLSAVAPALRGDLETMIRKALERDPARRYESAGALAEDLRRFLAYQPIVARPPSVTYQLQLFARRHRALVAGASLGLAALILAAVISTGFAVRAQQSATREVRQRQIAERTNAHLRGMLSLPNPHDQRPDLTVLEMIDMLSRRLDEREELPEVEAEVRRAIGGTYLNLRRPAQAAAQLSRAVDLWRAIDPERRRLGRALIELGTARMYNNESAASETAYREAIQILERYGDADLDAAQGGLLDILIMQRHFADAASLAEALVQRAGANADAAPVVLIARLRSRAKVEMGLGNSIAAEATLLDARERAMQALPDRHPMHIGVLLDLCAARHSRGEHEGALLASAEAFALAERAGNVGSHDWLSCLNMHAHALEILDRRPELLALLRDAWTALADRFGNDHRTVRETDARLAALRRRWDIPEPAGEPLDQTPPAPPSPAGAPN